MLKPAASAETFSLEHSVVCTYYIMQLNDLEWGVIESKIAKTWNRRGTRFSQIANFEEALLMYTDGKKGVSGMAGNTKSCNCCAPVANSFMTYWAMMRARRYFRPLFTVFRITT